VSSVPAVFRVELVPDRTRILVAPHGEVDLATAGEVRDAIAEVRERGFDRIVLDLRGVTFIDSTGVSLLVRMRAASHEGSWSFSIIDGSEQVQHVLVLAGVSHLFSRASPPGTAA
jgi:anti-sigma B factor antagonist